MGEPALCLTGVRLGSAPDAVAVRCVDGMIAELGPDVVAAPNDRLLDLRGRGLIMLPGFVNAHTHAAMSLFRNYADDLPLMDWLSNHIWPIEARMVAEDVYWGTRLAALEMIRTGTVSFWDMYWNCEATAAAVGDAGLRATIGGAIFDAGQSAVEVERLKAVALDGLGAIPLISPLTASALAPHAIYTASASLLRWVAATAAEHDVPIHIHLSETADEVERCLDEHRMRPAFWLHQLGILGPKTLLAHSVWLDEAELDLIAETGATLVTNPVANLKLNVGRIFDYPAASARGIAVALGTDGPGSNNSLDLLAEAKHFALGQKQRADDPAAVPAAEVLALARGRRAPLFGAVPLALGVPADFILVRGDSPELGLGALDAGLVYAASGSIVDTTVVAGRVLMRGGVIEGAEEVLAGARGRAELIGLR